MKIVVTGASGFIGKAISLYLHSRGYEISAMVRPTSATTDLENAEIPLVNGNILQRSSLISVFHDIDTVIHCAGSVSDWGKKQDFIDANYLGTKNVLEACETTQIKKVIHTSTVDIFGH